MVNVHNSRQQILQRIKWVKILCELNTSFKQCPSINESLNKKLTESVLPEPVCAMPTMSLPLSARGQP